MSHNKNYGSYYKKEESKEESNISYEQKVEETQTTEGSAEVVQEEAPVEEPKVEAPAAKPVKTFAIVTGGKPCNMRFKPNKSSQVINVVPSKAKVTVLNQKGDWWKVKYKDYTGFMMSQFLKEE